MIHHSHHKGLNAIVWKKNLHDVVYEFLTHHFDEKQRYIDHIYKVFRLIIYYHLCRYAYSNKNLQNIYFPIKLDLFAHKH